MRFVFRAILIVLAVTTYFALAPIGYLSFFVWSLLPTRHPERRARVLLAIQRRAFRLLHWVARSIDAIEFYPNALARSQPSTPSVLVANHPTLTDVTAIMAAFPNTVTIVKPQLFHRWWAKPLLQSAGFLESPGQDTTRLASIMESAQQRLNQGFHVLIFPEGTRSPQGELLPFGRTAFEIACRAKVPVVPIAIRCEPLWLSKETPIQRFPASMAKLQLDVLPAVDPAELDYSSRALRQVVRSRITHHLSDSASLLPS